jgi:protein JBTS26
MDSTNTQFVFWTTHGDVYYIGLDGLALLDAAGARIPLRAANIHAIPASVNDLGPGSADPRIPGNLSLLFDPVYVGVSFRVWLCVGPCLRVCVWQCRKSSNNQAWLAPLAHSLQPGAPNLLYIALNQPVALGGVQLWNYSKNPARGIGNVEVWMDELLIYCGEVKAASETGLRRQPHTILFTNSPAVLDKHRADVSSCRSFSSRRGRFLDISGWHCGVQVSYCGAVEQDVLCINERKVMQATRATKPDPTAHGVVIDLTARPTTAIGHFG